MQTGKRDVLAQAQSGTGKTGTFVIGSLQKINYDLHEPQVLILAPTRELAVQTQGVATDIGHYLGAVCYALVGGIRRSWEDEERLRQVRLILLALTKRTSSPLFSHLQRPPHLVVGTPGRVMDMIRRRALNTETIRTLVVDEADEMLSFGFQEQLYDIFQTLPRDVKVGLFSATMPKEIFEITKRFMNDPIM